MIIAERRYIEASFAAHDNKAGWKKNFPNTPYSLTAGLEIFHKPENQDFIIHLQKRRLAKEYKDNPLDEKFTRFMTVSVEKLEEYLGDYLHAAA